MKYKLSLILFLSTIFSYTPVAFTQPAVNYNDTSRQVNRSVLRTTATEICNNNIDDDNNGLVDDQDFACYFNGLNATSCKSNAIVWSVSPRNELYWFNLNTGDQQVVGTLPLTMLDITWAAKGKLYGLSVFPPYIYEIDPHTAGITPVNNVPSGYTAGKSMTADAFGNIYYDCSSNVERFQIMKFNVITGDACIVAHLGSTGLFPSGDLTFLDGILYQTCSNGSIISIDLHSNIIQIQSFISPFTANFFGIAGMPDGYLYVAYNSEIYKVNPSTMVVYSTPVVRLNNGLTSNGLAAYNELCQAPTCLGRTGIQADGNPPYCNTIGVFLKGNVTPTVCGVSITNISWETTNGTIVPGDRVKALAPGKYYLNYQTNTETCNRMDSFTVQYAPNAPLAVDTSYQLPIGCNCNGTITAIAGCGSGNYQYNWNTGATTATINNVCPGIYTVKVTDAVSGKDTTVRIVIPSPPNSIQLYDITAIGDHCNQGDGSIHIANILGGTPPFQYAIDNQPFSTTPAFTSLPAGIYNITVKDAANCALQQQATIQPVAAPKKLSYTKQDAYCGLLTGTITIDKVLDGSPPYSFAVNNGPFNPQPTLTNLLPGPGTLTVKDNYGCTLNEPFTILQSDQLRIAVSPKDTNICASQKVTFTATVLSNSAGVTYSWNGTSSANNVFTTPFLDHSKMIVRATDNTGCIAADSATITAPYCDSIFAKCVLFPNAFSPNHDGLNDTFGPHFGDCEIKSYQLSVYNRWGQLIFQTREQSKKWNGATNAQTPQTGTYIYTCTWQDAIGHFHHHKGAIVLVQ